MSPEFILGSGKSNKPFLELGLTWCITSLLPHVMADNHEHEGKYQMHDLTILLNLSELVNLRVTVNGSIRDSYTQMLGIRTCVLKTEHINITSSCLVPCTGLEIQR